MGGSAAAVQLTQYVTAGINFGVLGIIFWLFVGGKLHSDTELEHVRKDLEEEKRAHDMTRQALSLANERANTSVMTGELVLKALGGGNR
jgi:ribosomal protein S3